LKSAIFVIKKETVKGVSSQQNPKIKECQRGSPFAELQMLRKFIGCKNVKLKKKEVNRTKDFLVKAITKANGLLNQLNITKTNSKDVISLNFKIIILCFLILFCLHYNKVFSKTT